MPLILPARVGSAATLKTRSDDGRSLFGPSGKPAAEDVTNCERTRLAGVNHCDTSGN